jgi:hypothetical protein
MSRCRCDEVIPMREVRGELLVLTCPRCGWQLLVDSRDLRDAHAFAALGWILTGYCLVMAIVYVIANAWTGVVWSAFAAVALASMSALLPSLVHKEIRQPHVRMRAAY